MEVNGTNLKMTRGDSERIAVSLTGYTLQEGDVYRSKTGTYDTPTELLYEPKDVPAMLERVV